MFVVDLPVPKNCYECPLCDYEQGFCTLSGLAGDDACFNASHFSNVMMLAKGNKKPDVDYISRSLRIDKIEVEQILELGGKHPNCPIQEVNMNNCCCKTKESE